MLRKYAVDVVACSVLDRVWARDCEKDGWFMPQDLFHDLHQLVGSRGGIGTLSKCDFARVKTYRWHVHDLPATGEREVDRGRVTSNLAPSASGF